MSDLDARIRRLERRTQHLPVRWAGGGGGGDTNTFSGYWAVFNTFNGNELLAGPPVVVGIKKTATEVLAPGWIYRGQNAVGTASIALGAVTAIAVTVPGELYGVAPAVTLAGGGGTGATATATINDFNLVKAANITNAGDYLLVPTVTFAAAPAGGTTATGTAVLRANKLVRIDIVNPGKGYTSTPAITITPAAGETLAGGGVATAIMSKGSVVTFNVTNGGSDYTSAPTVTVAASVTTIDLGTATDGLGKGIAVVAAPAGTVTGDAIVVGRQYPIVNDPRSVIPYALVGAASYPTSQRVSDAIISWGSTMLRIAGSAAEADGIVPVILPMGGGA